jgi:hypothetical protein
MTFRCTNFMHSGNKRQHKRLALLLTGKLLSKPFVDMFIISLVVEFYVLLCVCVCVCARARVYIHRRINNI